MTLRSTLIRNVIRTDLYYESYFVRKFQSNIYTINSNIDNTKIVLSTDGIDEDCIKFL